LWAAAILIGLFGLVVTVVVHGVTFGLLRVVSLARDRVRTGRASTPPQSSAPT
jgi:hypothetical protein